WHHHVEHQGVGAVIGDQVEGFTAVLRQLYRISVERERPAQGFAHRAVVVNDKYAHSHSVYPSPETDLRGAPLCAPSALAAVEINKAEAGGLEKAPRHLVLLAGDGHTHELGALGLPLCAPATGVRARHPALGHGH